MDIQDIRESLSEADFMTTVIEMAKIHGWLIYHTHDSRRSQAGYPDLCLTRLNQDGSASLVFLELKSQKGKPTLAQIEWLDVLGRVPGVIAAVYRPSDFEKIAELLI